MAHLYLLIAVLVIAGWAAVYIALERMLKRTGAELRREFQRQIDALSNVKILERTGGSASAAASAQASATEEITPETLRTITETVSALLGRKVRVRSVKVLPTPDATINSWAQQGRVVIQASHNIGLRGRE